MSINIRELEKQGYVIMFPPFKGIMARKGDVGINNKGEEVPMPALDFEGEGDGSKPEKKADPNPKPGTKAELKASVKQSGGGKRARRGAKKPDPEVSDDGAGVQAESGDLISDAG